MACSSDERAAVCWTLVYRRPSSFLCFSWDAAFGVLTCHVNHLSAEITIQGWNSNCPMETTWKSLQWQLWQLPGPDHTERSSIFPARVFLTFWLTEIMKGEALCFGMIFYTVYWYRIIHLFLFLLLKVSEARTRWLMPVILPTWEAKIRMIAFQGSSQDPPTPSPK
jgi:hypothetical protein